MEADKNMPKPTEPKNSNFELWRKYYESYEKYLIRKRAQDKRYRIKCRQQEIIRHAQYRFTHREQLAETRRIKFSKPENRQKEIERLFRYIAKNPYCNLVKMERFIKCYERTVPLQEWDVKVK